MARQAWVGGGVGHCRAIPHPAPCPPPLPPCRSLQALLEAHPYVTLVDIPPEEERTEEPEGGVETMVRALFAQRVGGASAAGFRACMHPHYECSSGPTWPRCWSAWTTSGPTRSRWASARCVQGRDAGAELLVAPLPPPTQPNPSPVARPTPHHHSLRRSTPTPMCTWSDSRTRPSCSHWRRRWAQRVWVVAGRSVSRPPSPPPGSTHTHALWERGVCVFTPGR